MTNVVPITPEASVQTSALARPKHMKGKLKDVWDDLVSSIKPELATQENRFTIEIAATLLNKFRSGQAMTATESKELKRAMVALGLAQDDDGERGSGKPKRNTSKYFND